MMESERRLVKFLRGTKIKTENMTRRLGYQSVTESLYFHCLLSSNALFSLRKRVVSAQF